MELLEKIELLGEIEEQISVCRKCSLCDDRVNAIFGSGTFKAEVLLIRDYPEFEEDRTSNTWASPSSRLLEKVMHAAHINIHKIYSTYLVHCRPSDNKLIASDIKCCENYTLELLKIMQPKIVILCGRTVCQYFLGNTKKITDLHGEFIENEIKDVGKFLFYPINHPTTMVRFPLTKKKEMFDDLNKLFAKIVECGAPY